MAARLNGEMGIRGRHGLGCDKADWVLIVWSGVARVVLVIDRLIGLAEEVRLGGVFVMVSEVMVL
jgi:hypothetical protein